MIDSSVLYDTLNHLVDRYDSEEATSKDQYLYAKLAVIEVCGWIEECMDDMVLDMSDRHIRRPRNVRIVQQEVNRIHGFRYNAHFRRLLTWIAGSVNVEKLEARLDPAKFQRLISELDSLATVRNQLAHTHTSFSPNFPNVEAPLRIRQRFDGVLSGLQDIETELNLIAY